MIDRQNLGQPFSGQNDWQIGSQGSIWYHIGPFFGDNPMGMTQSKVMFLWQTKDPGVGRPRSIADFKPQGQVRCNKSSMEHKALQGFYRITGQSRDGITLFLVRRVRSLAMGGVVWIQCAKCAVFTILLVYPFFAVVKHRNDDSDFQASWGFADVKDPLKSTNRLGNLKMGNRFFFWRSQKFLNYPLVI